MGIFLRLTRSAVTVLLGAAIFAGVPMRGPAAAQPVNRPATVASLVSVRILFGITDTAPAQWDGSVQIDSGSVKAIQGVRFGPEDSTDYSTSWKAATRVQGQEILENGVIVTAAAKPDSRWSIRTSRGDFSFTLLDLPWGELRSYLDGAVEVDRVPPTTQLTTSDDDEDFPAIARAPDGLWLTYVRFSHANRSQESFAPMRTAPSNFDYLARPAGGDQAFATRYSAASNSWTPVFPLSPKGENITRTAVAVDGQNRVWAVWSGQREGNFDIFARVYKDNAWGPEVRVTTAAGPDLSPVAATDAAGRVWIAWQGYRNNNLEVLTAVENGDSFSPEAIVSTSPASDWAPAIAAAPNGDVAISWDTYDKGDYDVYFRRLRMAASKIEMDGPVAAAATPFFEAHSSIVFDGKNRLWLAYEISTARWGKNFGLYDTSGTPLYEDRNIRVKCFDGASVYTTSADLLNVLPGTPIAQAREPRTRPNRLPLQPNPNIAKNRRPGQGVAPRAGPLNSFPRITADPAGGIYVAFRSLSRPANLRSPLGSIWTEHVVYFDGHKWIGPVFLPRTDGLLEGRPALLAPESNHLIAVSAMDHRQATPQGVGQGAAERINSDLYLADLVLDGYALPAAKAELVALPGETVSAPDPRVKAEADQVAAVRNYRMEIAGEQFRILRGDFHRHTEYSIDGTRDGSLDDAYRYMIDAAALDWGGCCDYENGEGHEYFWWREQTMTDEYKLGGRFTPMFAFEHAVRYPEGHRIVMFAKRGIRPLPHLPPVAIDAAPAPAPDTQMLYSYLKAFGGISIPATTATDLGTDWRDNDREAEPAVEIYEGDRQSYEKADGPRAAKEGDALANLRPAGYVTAALDKGYRLGFMASSDRLSTHISYAGVIAPEATREAILYAIRKRHVYASTDNIIADVRSGDHLMGDEFTVAGQPRISVKLIGTGAFAKVTIVKDGKEVYTVEPKTKEVGFEWSDSGAEAGKTSYYYVRGEQVDGQLVWVSPMWIGVSAK